MSYVSIAVPVHNVMAELQESSDRQFQRYLQFAYRTHTDLNLYVLPVYKTILQTMDDMLGIDLPKDFISYKKIGVCMGGQIVTLTKNNEICLDRNVDECCEVIKPAEPDTLGFSPYYFLPAWRNGKYVAEQYAATGGVSPAGYFRVDTEKWRIQFVSAVPKSEIILEYKSNGIECDGAVAIPEEAVEAMIAGIMWKRIQNSPKVPVYEKQRAFNDYRIQYNKLQMFYSAFTDSEYRDDRYSTIRSTAKR